MRCTTVAVTPPPTTPPPLPDIDSPREDGKQVVQEGLVDCSRRCRPPPVVRRPDDYFVTQQLGRIDNVILVHAFVSDNYVTGLPQSAGAGQHRLCGRHRAGGEPMVPTIKFQEAGNRRLRNPLGLRAGVAVLLTMLTCVYAVCCPQPCGPLS